MFERIRQSLAQWLQPALQAYHDQHGTLAPFASEVIAVDETVLDRVSRRLPILRHFKKGESELLPGKRVSRFDVRLQQWRSIEHLNSASENGREQARQLLSRVKKAALILADRGYFAFRWFDELTEQGYSWISRLREGTTLVVLHTYYEAGDTFDRLVWLGAWDYQANYAVRQVQFRKARSLAAVPDECVQSDHSPPLRDRSTLRSSLGHRVGILDPQTGTGVAPDLE